MLHVCFGFLCHTLFIGRLLNLLITKLPHVALAPRGALPFVAILSRLKRARARASVHVIVVTTRFKNMHMYARFTSEHEFQFVSVCPHARTIIPIP